MATVNPRVNFTANLTAHPAKQLVVFALEGQSFALELQQVHRVIRSLEITPLPHAPKIILGLINVQGTIFAAVNLRHRFGLPPREITPSDQFVLVSYTSPARQAAQATPTPQATRQLALVVDSVVGMIEVEAQQIIQGDEMIPTLEHVQGVAKLADDLIFIHNLERCLSLQEEQMLDHALTNMATPDTAATKTATTKIATTKTTTHE